MGSKYRCLCCTLPYDKCTCVTRLEKASAPPAPERDIAQTAERATHAAVAWSPLHTVARQCYDTLHKEKTRIQRIAVIEGWLKIVANEITERAPAIPRNATLQMIKAGGALSPLLTPAAYSAIWAAMWDASLNADHTESVQPVQQNASVSGGVADQMEKK